MITYTKCTYVCIYMYILRTLLEDVRSEPRYKILFLTLTHLKEDQNRRSLAGRLCSVPVSHDRVTGSQHAQYQDPETEAAKRNSAIIICYYLHLCFSYCDLPKCLPLLSASEYGARLLLPAYTRCALILEV